MSMSTSTSPLKTALPFPIETLEGIPCIKKEHLKRCLKEVQLIDVRTEKEFKEGSISGALHLPIGTTLDTFLNEEKDRNRNKVMVFYCHRGGRSGRATLASRDKGFANTFSLAGGFSEWKSESTEEST